MKTFQEVQEYPSRQRHQWMAADAAGLIQMMRAELAPRFAHVEGHAPDDSKEAMGRYVQDFARQGRAAVEPIKS